MLCAKHLFGRIAKRALESQLKSIPLIWEDGKVRLKEIATTDMHLALYDEKELNM